jgi:hypothetical protein
MAVDQLTSFIVVIKRLPHEVDVVGQRLSMALHEHEVDKQGERAGEGPAIQPFTHDIPCCCCAVGASSGYALNRVVSAFVPAGSTQQECVGVVLGMLTQPYAQLADGQLRNEVRCFE